MSKQKPYVRIQSTMNIQVTCGLNNIDVTNPDAHVPDRLKISPTWPTCIVKIDAGVGVYPSEIIGWPTVQALAKDKILTIGELLDDADETVVNKKTTLVEAMKAANIIKDEKQNEEPKSIKLSDIAGE